MRLIRVDWSTCKSKAQFFDEVVRQCEFPDWFGRNLDALSDAWSNGSISSLGPPFRFSFENRAMISPELEVFAPVAMEIARESVAAHGGSYAES